MVKQNNNSFSNIKFSQTAELEQLSFQGVFVLVGVEWNGSVQHPVNIPVFG